MNEMCPRVLVGTPIYEKKEYCREKFVENVKRLDYPNFHWCLVDNSRTSMYSSKLRRLYPGHAVRVNRGGNSRDALANASNFLRQKVLSEGYDYLLMLESDVFPPRDVIWRLLQHGRPVVGARYHIGNSLAKAHCIFEVVNKGGFIGTQLIPRERQGEFENKGLKQVHGMGVGCVLIHRSILERFAFWYSSLDDERMAEGKIRKHPDVYFYLDLHNAGIKVFCDTDIYCDHQWSAWESVDDV